MRRMLYIAATLVFIAGIQLFVLTERTDRFFAWTIGVPLTAAFLGAGYWAAGLLEFLAARERYWANVRAAVFPVWVFTVLTTVATLLHLDTFRTESFWAWAWFAVYFIVPVALGIILIQQSRAPGGDPPRTAPFPTWLRALLVVQVVVMIPVGAALMIAPGTADTLWPWGLPPLAARAAGAWLIGWSAIMVQAIMENDHRRARIPFVASLAWTLLIGIAIARHGGPLDWGSAHTWLFLLFVLSIFGAGLYGVLAGWGVLRRRKLRAPEFAAREY
jgi:hypothetical protein